MIAGPCVIEDAGFVLEVATELKRQLSGLPIEFYFKASFEKANRTSVEGFRGPGLVSGLKTLEQVKAKTGHRLLTDFHLPEQAEAVAAVCDGLQVPAFLCRQTDMIVAGAQAAKKHGRLLNVKKGQFLAPWDARNIVEKVQAAAPGTRLALTERGVSFGYNQLVVDMSAFQILQGFGVPAIYDATHSIQTPGAGPGGKSTGGRRDILEVLARAAVAAGADGVFFECHPEPAKAKSDGPNALYLDKAGEFVKQLLALREVAVKLPKLLPEART